MNLYKAYIRPECSDYFELRYIRITAYSIYAWRNVPHLFNHSIYYYTSKELDL